VICNCEDPRTEVIGTANAALAAQLVGACSVAHRLVESLGSLDEPYGCDVMALAFGVWSNHLIILLPEDHDLAKGLVPTETLNIDTGKMMEIEETPVPQRWALRFIAAAARQDLDMCADLMAIVKEPEDQFDVTKALFLFVASNISHLTRPEALRDSI
jgi:hypothetical protein